MIHRNQRIIDLSCIENNMRQIRSEVPQNVKIMAVVKADGYGHGAVETAYAAINGGADMLAVASVAEGAALRKKGLTVPILVLSAVTTSDVLQGAENNLIQTVCSAEMVALCEKASSEIGKQTEVHLKIDTGMGRIGVRTEEELDVVLKSLRLSSHVKMTGVFTHFSDADGDNDGKEFTYKQYEKFLTLTAKLPQHILRHCCNSAAIHRFPDMKMDMVRVGISLYGYPPVKTDIFLKPCMKWTAVVSYIKTVPAGTYISYGRSYCADQSIRVGTVTCGYGDGFHRSAGLKGYVLIHGKKAKIIGRVCMDQMMVDLTDIPDASEGDEVVIMGNSGAETITAEDIASWCGTISYEILLSAGSRVERVYTSSFDERNTL